MKVIGLGTPHSMRIRFDACEIDVLVDVLRQQRTRATLDTADAYRCVRHDDPSAVDDRHDALRALEGLLMQLEDQLPDEQGRVALVGETSLISDVVHAGAREALRRLNDTHDRYRQPSLRDTRNVLAQGADTVRAWIVTLTSLDGVDEGPDA